MVSRTAAINAFIKIAKYCKDKIRCNKRCCFFIEENGFCALDEIKENGILELMQKEKWNNN